MSDEKTISPFKNLIVSLEQEIDLYSKMAQSIKNKQDAIISGQTEKLREHVAEEKSYIKESQEMAQNRKQIQRQISSNFNLNSEVPRLKTIIEVAPSDAAIQLSNLRYRLKEILNNITRMNNENKLLLDFSIEHVKGMAQLFLNINNEDHEVYGIDGVVRMKQSDNKMLDYQI